MKEAPSLEILKDWVESRQNEKLLSLFEESNLLDLADIFVQLEPDEIIYVFSLLDIPTRAELFSHFPAQIQYEIFKRWTNREFAQIFKAMRSNERVDFFQNLDPEEQRELLPYLDAKTRSDLFHLASYPPESAGGIMSSDFVAYREEETIEEVLQHIKEEAPRKRSLYYIYVVDEEKYLKGVLSFRELLISPIHSKLSDVMSTPVVSAVVDEDREVVARRMEEYGLIALPVTNKNGQIIGIVEHDVAIETLRAEETEDLEKFMGITRDEPESLPYLETTIWEHFRRRVSWVTVLAILGIISGLIIHNYERALESLIILAFYMPMLADTGGNCGSQAATLVVRSLALKELNVSDWFKVILKEARVGLLMAGVLAVISFVKVQLLSSQMTLVEGISLNRVAVVVTVAMSIQVVTSTVIGGLLPILVKALRGDPAVAASPLITTVVDASGLLIYFNTARLILDLS